VVGGQTGKRTEHSQKWLCYRELVGEADLAGDVVGIGRRISGGGFERNLERVAGFGFVEIQASGMEIRKRGDELKRVGAAGEAGDGQLNETCGVLRGGRIGLVGLHGENF